MAGVANLVHQTSTTTGTGNFTLSSVNGKQSFSGAFSTGGTDVFYYFISNQGAGEWEIGTGHMSDATTLVRDTVIASTNSNAAVSFSAGTKDVTNDIPAGYQAASPFLPRNVTLTASVAANALTIALKTEAGSDASPTDPVLIPFRSATAATGSPVSRAVTAALSLTISSGSTLGTTSSAAFRIWVVAFDDAGTIRLGAVNCSSGTASSSPNSVIVYPLPEYLASSTAEGGAGAADSAGVIYTGTAVTTKAYRILGYLTWESGLATAGTWSSGPTVIQLFGPGTKKPGETIQTIHYADGNVATGTTILPGDNTIPQDTEGDQYMSASITPTSSANVLRVSAQAFMQNNGGAQVAGAIFRSGTANALAAIFFAVSGGFSFLFFPLAVQQRAGSTSSVTYNFRGGGTVAGTTTFNGSAGGQFFGGVMNSFITVQEIMA